MLPDEKERKLEELESLVQDIQDRVEAIDEPDESFIFTEHGYRQVIVHWIKDEDIDPADTPEGEEKLPIVSIGVAKTEFLAQARAIDLEGKRPAVDHGDLMVIGGECPWYCFCARVDAQRGESGFQLEDDIEPPVAESDTDEDPDEPKVFREFIVWGGCGAGDGGDECPPGSSVSVVGSVSTSGGTPADFTKVLSKQASTLPVLSHTLDKLKALSLTKNVNDSSQDDAEDFLAFGESFTQCSSDCAGLFVNLKKFSSTQEKYDLAATVSLNNLKLTPNELIPTPLKISSTTLSVTDSTISSDPCGSLSSVAGSSSSSVLTQISKEAAETAQTIYDPSVEPVGETKVSIGVNLPTGVRGSAISSVNNVFLPVIPGDTCPESTTFNFMSGATLSISEDNSGCDGGTSEQCKTINVSMTPIVGSMTFNCGVLTSSTAPTAAGQTPLEESFKVACGCNPVSSGCAATSSATSVTLLFQGSNIPVGGTEQNISESIVLSPNGCDYFAGTPHNLLIRPSIVQGAAVWTLSGSGGTGGWSVSGTGASPNGITTTTQAAPGKFLTVTTS